jgi:hypothetical protein
VYKKPAILKRVDPFYVILDVFGAPPPAALAGAIVAFLPAGSDFPEPGPGGPWTEWISLHFAVCTFGARYRLRWIYPTCLPRPSRVGNEEYCGHIAFVTIILKQCCLSQSSRPTSNQLYRTRVPALSCWRIIAADATVLQLGVGSMAGTGRRTRRR